MSHRFDCPGPWHRLMGVFCLAVALALAQNSVAQTVQANQADLARTQSETAGLNAYPGGIAPSSPNDSDLGEQELLKGAGGAGYQPFTASVALPVYWTSNVMLSRSHEQSDWLEAPIAALFYQPRLTSNLYGIVGVREQLFYYDRFSHLNFGSFDAEGGLIYTVPQWHNLILRGEFIYNRLTEKNSFESFFSNYSFFLNAELPFQIGQAQQLSLGVDANLSVTADPEQPRRNDYEFYVGYSVALARSFSFDAVGRVVARTYQLTDRTDVSEILAGSLTYTVNKYITASAITTFVANQSNHSEFDYKVVNLGGVLSLSVKF
jgi:Putative beta-barrel porin 2